ncbi:MAG: hypothetical protein ACJ79K_06010 [Gemmatimonadaceae bacterium]
MRTTCLFALYLSVLAVACTSRGEHRTDSAAGTVDTSHSATAGVAGANQVLRRMAGAWEMTARPTAGRDSTPTRVRLNATGDTTGWTMVLGGQTVPLHVRVSGDTVFTTSDPYSSVRRKGVQVRTTATHVLDGDRLVGTTIAHYVVKGADSARVFNTEARRVQ